MKLEVSATQILLLYFLHRSIGKSVFLISFQVALSTWLPISVHFEASSWSLGYISSLSRNHVSLVYTISCAFLWVLLFWDFWILQVWMQCERVWLHSSKGRMRQKRTVSGFWFLVFYFYFYKFSWGVSRTCSSHVLAIKYKKVWDTRAAVSQLYSVAYMFDKGTTNKFPCPCFLAFMLRPINFNTLLPLMMSDDYSWMIELFIMKNRFS